MSDLSVLLGSFVPSGLELDLCLPYCCSPHALGLDASYGLSYALDSELDQSECHLALNHGLSKVYMVHLQRLHEELQFKVTAT